MNETICGADCGLCPMQAACGGCRKTCKTNYARAVLILWGIGLLMAAVFLMVGFLVLGPDVMFDFWEAVAEAIRKL